MEYKPGQFTNAMDAHARWEAEKEKREEGSWKNPTPEEIAKKRREDEEHAATLLYWDEMLTSFENRIDNADYDYVLELIAEFEERNPFIYDSTYKEWGQRLIDLKHEALRGKDIIQNSNQE